MAFTVVRGRRLIGIQTAGNPFCGFWAHIFVDCMLCDTSFGLIFDSNEEADNYTDKQFKHLLSIEGWKFISGKEIICDKCLQLKNKKVINN